MIYWSLVTFLAALTGMSVFFLSSQPRPGQLHGIQLVGKEQTFLIGRDRYTDELTAWRSKHPGYFDDRGGGHFYAVRPGSKQHQGDNWSAKWEWSELVTYPEMRSVLDLRPGSPNVESAKETMASYCRDRSACDWQVRREVSLMGVAPGGLLCVSVLMHEDYGGAHPLALRRLRTLDPESGEFLGLRKLIPEVADRQEIWRRLLRQLPEAASETDNGSKRDTRLERLDKALARKGYALETDAMCPVMTTAGSIRFGFPHSTQVNSGTNLYMSVPLSDLRVSDRIPLDSYRTHQPSQEEPTYLMSPDERWQATRRQGKVEIRHRGSRLEVELKGADRFPLRGLIWLRHSPTPEELERYGFRKLSPAEAGQLMLGSAAPY